MITPVSANSVIVSIDAAHVILAELEKHELQGGAYAVMLNLRRALARGWRFAHHKRQRPDHRPTCGAHIKRQSKRQLVSAATRFGA